MYLNTYFRDGDWNAICDSCGFKYKASQLRERWDGMMVCPKDFEFRHPLDFIRAPAPQAPIPWSRPDSEIFINGPVCTIETRQAIAGIGVTGCMIAGYNPDI